MSATTPPRGRRMRIGSEHGLDLGVAAFGMAVTFVPRAMVGVLFLLLAIGSGSMTLPVLSADDGESSEGVDAWVEKKFLLLPAGSDFAKAERLARRVAARLHLPLGDATVFPSEETGLTFTKEACVEGGLDYPCYVARGRYDDGLYVSIELARQYLTDDPSAYVVVMASGLPEGAYSDYVVTEARRRFSGARVVSSRVYMGCLH